ncbi:hypothetical protein L1987_51592 [Smallanthus sonchifolius]|uniref:Uncharacterized protein n=1 Tax=Smallanthus sonchifolius TaxID=185202 RepID=A0ACB9ER50_9ASTR|nr:hypothetical protein L1987_51592 [Smallanthus sonchifolius]
MTEYLTLIALPICPCIPQNQVISSARFANPWTKGCRPIPPSNFFGLFYLKSKIGHALMLLLQVGVLEKFKSIPLVTGLLDLACFAAAIFVSSAGLFILSQLSVGINT